MNLSSLLNELITNLTAFEQTTHEVSVFVGIDGYIDKIQKVVKSQVDQQNTYFPDITDFAGRVREAAGVSAQLELVTLATKLGGNAPIMAHALASLGLSNYCLGNFGTPELHPLFQQIHPASQLISLGPPAETNALEFDDGKLILSEVGPFQSLDWNFVKTTIGLPALIEHCASTRCIALVDWCNLPQATDIWRGISQEVIPCLDDTPRHFFFDLADPTKKPLAAIVEVLEVIGAFKDYGTVTLGLNENEAVRLAQTIGEFTGHSVDGDLTENSAFIFEHTNLSTLLVHPTNRAIVVTSDGVRVVPGRVVAKPKITTGGGDNLNAGFCFGQLAGYSPEMSALLGMATSGAYVQDGASPDRATLLQYLRNWKN